MNSDETPFSQTESSEIVENREETSLTEEAEVSEIPPTEPFLVEMMQNEAVEGSEPISLQPKATVIEAAEPLKTEVDLLKAQKEGLKTEIQALKLQKQQLLTEQTQVQQTLGQIVKEGLRQLEEQRQSLEVAIEQLERRRDRIRAEMRTTFAGVSQDLAIRLQGFKDYLVGSLQDLAATAEQLELPTGENWGSAPPSESVPPMPDRPLKVQFSQSQFEDQTRQIQRILEQYRTRPDYYGAPWQLRRTFEPIHAERVQNWFFSQGGRGAIRSMGSRLQNILIASAVISVLYSLYGDRVRTLILANTPERLGEWRRGLQDCLGISRSDFGPERGMVLFESSEALVQKADRLEEDKLLPLIVIDETEDPIDLSLLQFPLWLAFAREPQQMSSYAY